MTNTASLLDMPWEDVLFLAVLPRLKLADLYKLRRVSTASKEMVELYLTTIQRMNLSFYRYPRFNTEAFKVIQRNCHSVTMAAFNSCKWLDDKELVEFLEHNVNIVSLDLSHCDFLTTSAFQHVIHKCKELHTLKLNGCDWLQDGALDTLTCFHTKLENVVLAHCPNISETSIMKFIVKFQNLQSLSLCNNQQVTNRTALTIAQHSRNLEDLNIQNCSITEDGFQCIIFHCKKLETLIYRRVHCGSELKQLRLFFHPR